MYIKLLCFIYMGIFYSLLFLSPLALLLLCRSPITLTQILQPLCFCNLVLHLQNQHLQFLLALLAGMGVNIAGVFFTVGPFRGVAAFKQVIVDLADAAGARLALAAHVGLEIGHFRLFRLGLGNFLPWL